MDHPSSIYEENPVDPKIGIPQNTYMFECIIKDAFDIHESSSDEEEDKKDILTEKEWHQKCMEIYERKNPIKVGRLAGPNSK